ncbi:hypothetical protein M8A51_23115 [Schlegelella sp. S2-27]|uniref:Broad specificity phosphatase PhoE n=1 Tax=Caldimonas mangrovi TaxID=2944811 RepID=A0ABT0YVV6_9BURK|nr:hypothetical protein [Caldimonas mangrovi]MCM5682429.1 hypothetical protein [Caldimonas mangrovi]
MQSFVGRYSGEEACPTYLALARQPVFLPPPEAQPALFESFALGQALQPFFNGVGLLGDEEGVPWVTAYGPDGESAVSWAMHGLGLLASRESIDRIKPVSLRTFKARWPGFGSSTDEQVPAGGETQQRFVRRIMAGLSEAFLACQTVTNARDKRVRAMVLITPESVLEVILSEALLGTRYFRDTRWVITEELSTRGRVTVLRSEG